MSLYLLRAVALLAGISPVVVQAQRPASQPADTSGKITGVIMGEHHEPYGDFSIDPPKFAATFRNKDVRDPFKLGEDVDAVSRATITMSSAVRAIRNSARRMARQYLTAPPASR